MSQREIRRSSDRDGNRDRDNRACYHCGALDHFMRNCPKAFKDFSSPRGRGRKSPGSGRKSSGRGRNSSGQAMHRSPRVFNNLNNSTNEEPSSTTGQPAQVIRETAHGGAKSPASTATLTENNVNTIRTSEAAEKPENNKKSDINKVFMDQVKRALAENPNRDGSTNKENESANGSGEVREAEQLSSELDLDSTQDSFDEQDVDVREAESEPDLDSTSESSDDQDTVAVEPPRDETTNESIEVSNAADKKRNAEADDRAKRHLSDWEEYALEHGYLIPNQRESIEAAAMQAVNSFRLPKVPTEKEWEKKCDKMDKKLQEKMRALEATIDETSRRLSLVQSPPLKESPQRVFHESQRNQQLLDASMPRAFAASMNSVPSHMFGFGASAMPMMPTMPMAPFMMPFGASVGFQYPATSYVNYENQENAQTSSTKVRDYIDSLANPRPRRSAMRSRPSQFEQDAKTNSETRGTRRSHPRL